MSFTSHIPVLKGSIGLHRKSTAVLLCALCVLTSPTTILAGNAYWAVNMGSTTPSGAWSTSSSWAGNKNGNGQLSNWTQNDNAFFSAKVTATGSYTVTTSGSEIVNNITVQEGSPTISGALTITSGAALSAASGTNLTFSSTITATNFTVLGGGTVKFGAAESFTSVSLGGGTTLVMSGSTSITTLNITSSSVIDFAGTSGLALNIGTLNISSGAVLNIINYNSSQSDTFLTTTFNYNSSAVTSGSTPFLTFDGVSGIWNSTTGTIRPVPEPSAYGALFMASALGGFFWTRRRRPPV